jgi:hypothetical protein
MGAPKGGKGFKGVEKPNVESRYIKKVDLYKWLSKWMLRSYPGKEGEMLMTQGDSPSKFFTVDAVRDMLDGECSELIRRVIMGINLHACTIQSGLEAAQTFPNSAATLSDKRYKKSGVPQFLEWLQSDGQELQRLATYLNAEFDIKRTKADTKENLEAFIELFSDKDSADERMKTFAKMADCFSRCYAMSMSCMELTALCSKPKEWAKKIPEVEKQPPLVRKWIKDPKTMKPLFDAVASHMDASSRGRKRRYGSESGHSGDDASGAAETGRSDSSGVRVSKGQNRAGLKEKKKKASKDNSSEESERPAKKGKKTKKVRKGASSSDASQSSGSPKGQPKRRRMDRGGMASALEPAGQGQQQQGNTLELMTLEDIEVIEREAAGRLDKANFLRLEASQMKTLVMSIPAPLRGAYMLPMTTRECDKAIVEADTIAGNIEQCMGALREFYMKNTVEIQKSRIKFVLEPALGGDGALQLLLKNDYLLNKEEIEKELAAEGLKPAERRRIAVARQRDVLRSQVMDCATSTRAWHLSREFSRAHARVEPKLDQIRALLDFFEDDLREALSIAPAAKYLAYKIRPPAYVRDVVRFYSISFLCFQAHNEAGVGDRGTGQEDAPGRWSSSMFGSGPGDPRRQKESLLSAQDEEDEDEFKALDPTAAYTTWALSEAQRVGTLMAVSKTNLDDKKNRLTLATWKETLGAIPDAILQAHGLGTLLGDLQGFTRMPKQEHLVPLLDKIQAMAEAVEHFYATQSGASQGSKDSATALSDQEKKDIEDAANKKQKADADAAAAAAVEQTKKEAEAAGDQKKKADAGVAAAAIELTTKAAAATGSKSKKAVTGE